MEPWYVTGRMPIGIDRNGAVIYRIEDQDDPDESRVGRAWAYREYGGKEWFPKRQKLDSNTEIKRMKESRII